MNIVEDLARDTDMDIERVSTPNHSAINAPIVNIVPEATSSPKSSSEIASLQKVTLLKGGKKRIQPVLLSESSTARVTSNISLSPAAVNGVSTNVIITFCVDVKYTLPAIIISDEKTVVIALPSIRNRIFISRSEFEGTLECRNDPSKNTCYCQLFKYDT